MNRHVFLRSSSNLFSGIMTTRIAACGVQALAPAIKKRKLSASASPPSVPEPGDLEEALERGRGFIRECAASPSKTLLLPDRDADGLSSGALLASTLCLLRREAVDDWDSSVLVHFIAPGRNMFAAEEQAAIAAICAENQTEHIIVVDQGSRAAPAIADGTAAKTLLIDHHQPAGFPAGATVVSDARPGVCAALLTHRLVHALHPAVAGAASWLAAVGAFGDLAAVPKDVPNPGGAWRQKDIRALTPLLNAPRRTPEANTLDAWRTLQRAVGLVAAGGKKPLAPLLDEPAGPVLGLFRARDRVRHEMVRCGGAPPRFSADGRIALVCIDSECQIHPVLAMRWANRIGLGSKALQMVMVANEGYVEGFVNFSCRAVKRKGTEEAFDVITLLEEFRMEGMGDDFARGHKAAAGGSLPTEVWERLKGALELQERGGGKTAGKGKAAGKRKAAENTQKNTLDAWMAGKAD